MEIVALVSRWAHVFSAIALVGGTIFMRFALVPAVSESLDDATHEKLREKLLARWARWVHGGVALLLISGLINIMLIIQQYEIPNKLYHPLFGVKFLLALPLFGIASILVGKSERAQKMRQNMKLWLNVNLLLAVLIIGIAGGLKMMDRTPKTAVPAVKAVDEFEKKVP